MFAPVIGRLLIAQKVSFIRPGAQWDQGTCISWEVVLISLEFPATLSQRLVAIAAEFNHVRLNGRQLLLLLFIAGSLFNDLQAFYDFHRVLSGTSCGVRDSLTTSIQCLVNVNQINMIF
jgi:hypothetical protein